MESMMRSLAQLVLDNAQVKFGIGPEDVELVLYPVESGEEDNEGNDHRKTLTLRHLRTIGGGEFDQAFNNASADWPGEIDAWLTIFEVLVTCRPPAANRGREDYYPNEAHTLADRVAAFFRGRGGTGRIVERTAYGKPGTPAEGDGVVQYPPRIDSQPETPGDPSHTIILTYEMTWWAPAPAES